VIVRSNGSGDVAQPAPRPAAVLDAHEDVDQQFLQPGPGLAVGGVRPPVHELVGVGLHVVELAGALPRARGPAVVHDELPAVVAQHRGVDGRVVGVPAVAVLAQRPVPPGGVLAREQAAQARALVPRGGRDPGEVEEGRRQVHPLHQLGAPRGREPAGPAHDQRHADRAVVVERALEHQLVVAEHLAVVAGEHHDGVVGQALRVEGVEDAPDLVVDERDHRVVGGAGLVELLVGVLGEAAGVPGVGAPRRLGEHRWLGPQLAVRVHPGRQPRRVIALPVLRRCAEAVMRVEEVRDEEERRAVLPGRGEEVDRLVGDPVAVVRLGGQGVPGGLPAGRGRLRVQVGVRSLQPPVVGVLRGPAVRVVRPSEDPEPVVEPRLGPSGEAGTEVELADEAAVVAVVGEQLREHLRVGRDVHAVGVQAVGGHVAPGHQGRPRRCADRVLHVAVLEQHALGGQPVQVRRGDVRVAVRTERVEALLVRADQEDIRAHDFTAPAIPSKK